MLKKILALVLALLMVMCLFAACSGDTKPNDDGNTPSGGDKDNNDGNSGSDGEIPTLHVYLTDSGNYQLWEGSEAEKKANEICEREIGCHFDITFVPNGEYANKITPALAAQDTIDVLWNAYWLGLTHKDLVEQGALLPLDDYLKEGGLMEDVYLQSGDDFVEGGTLNGHCYGVASIQRNYRYSSVWFNKKLAEEYNLVDQIMAINSYRDLIDVLDEAAKVAPDNVQLFYLDGGGEPQGWDMTIDSATGYIKDYSEILQTERSLVLDDDWKTVVFEEDNAYMHQINANRYELYHKGYVDSEIDGTAAQSLGASDLLFGGTYKWAPGWEAWAERGYNIEEVIGTVFGPVWSEINEYEQAQLGITKFTQDADLAAKWINLLYANKEFYNTLIWGVEGTDYTLDEEGRVIYDTANSFYLSSWCLANNYNSMVDNTMPADYWEQVAEINDAMAPMYLIGFSWTGDQNVETARSACVTVVSEYCKSLGGSTPLLHTTEKSFDDWSADYKNAYMQAGGQILIDAIQTQVTDFITNYR